MWFKYFAFVSSSKVIPLFASIKKAYRSYTENPFLFIWSSFLYLMMFFLFLFASLAVFMIYFFIVSFFNIPLSIESVEFLVPLAVVLFFFIFSIGGLNAGLIKAYGRASEGRKTSLVEYHTYSLSKAPLMLSIMLVREVLTLLAVGPVVFIYIEYLSGYEYLNYLVGLYVLCFLFLAHFVFTPVFASAGAMGTDMFRSFKNSFRLIKRKHLGILGVFIIFGIIWLLNFIPVVNLCSIFLIYPIILTAILVMMKNQGVGYD